MCASCMKEHRLGLSSNKGHNSCFIHLYINVFSVFLWVITYLGVWNSWLFPFEGSKLFIVSFIQHSTRFQRAGKGIFMFQTLWHRVLFLLFLFKDFVIRSTLYHTCQHQIIATNNFSKNLLQGSPVSQLWRKDDVFLACFRLPYSRKLGPSTPLPDWYLYGSLVLWNNLLYLLYARGTC